MVDAQLVRRGIQDCYVIAAMGKVPREAFVPASLEEFAYADAPLPIGEEQTISQPYVVALMIEAAAVKPGDRVLEVGAGSGYAAAVLSQIANVVYAIERHPSLVKAAHARFARLGYDNLEIRLGDGTLGWPQVAPFDAILVSAGGPKVPCTLKQQLAIGGRLVIPVGASGCRQNLLRVTRTAEAEFEEESLGSVKFVPLIGKGGWPEGGGREVRRRGRGRTQDLPELIAGRAETLPAFEAASLGTLFDRFADWRVVLLAEASYGSSEFYRTRAAITRHLRAHHAFTVGGVAADWPDAAASDRYVRHLPKQSVVDRPWQRFPSWMWRNVEVLELVEWMRAHNQDKPAEPQAGFYALDIDNLPGSIAAVLGYLDKVDPAKVARERYGCLTPWQKEPLAYARAVLCAGYRNCAAAVVEEGREPLQPRLQYSRTDGSGFLDAAQDARLVGAAERSFRAMCDGGVEAWNLRDAPVRDASPCARGAWCRCQGR